MGELFADMYKSKALSSIGANVGKTATKLRYAVNVRLF